MTKLDYSYDCVHNKRASTACTAESKSSYFNQSTIMSAAAVYNAYTKHRSTDDDWTFTI